MGPAPAARDVRTTSLIPKESDGDLATGAERTTREPAKKQKGGKGAAVAAVAPKAPAKAPKAAKEAPNGPRRCPCAHPRCAPASRARDTYLRM